MIADYTDAANRQHRYEAERGMHVEINITPETACCYCVAQIAYAMGEDNAGNAASERLPETFVNDDLDHVLAELAQQYPDLQSWLLRVAFEPERIVAAEARRAAKARVRAMISEVLA